MEATEHKKSQLSAEELFELKQNRDDANKAVSLALWSYIGLVIPLIGLILAGYSLSLSSDLPRTGSMGRKVKTARRNAGIAIFLSILVVVFWTAVYVVNTKEAQKQETQRQQTEQQQKQAEQDAQALQAQIKQSTLDACLKQADDNYSSYVKLNGTFVTEDAAQGGIYSMQQDKWDYVNNKKKTDQDECYRRSSIQQE